MRFWDSSALIPLLVREPRTAESEEYLREDQGIVVWWTTRTECTHALARKTRESELEPLGLAQSTVRLHRLRQSWAEIQPTQRLRALAETLLHRYPLRTADAYQLAAGISWRDGNPGGADFVCYDERLKEAAEGEGFTVLPRYL